MKIYGIKNCDTVKKALKFLKENNVNHEFIDFKKTAPTEELLATWEKSLGWEVLLNKRGTTYRKLSDEQKESITDAASAIKIMLENPSIIKRPVLNSNDNYLVGFDEEKYRDVI